MHGEKNCYYPRDQRFHGFSRQMAKILHGKSLLFYRKAANLQEEESKLKRYFGNCGDFTPFLLSFRADSFMVFW